MRAWHHTYGLPVVLSNCSNNYGPYHFPEKLIPLTILNALEGQPLPVYGKGENVRDWLYMEDHARALLLIAEKGRTERATTSEANNEKTNLEVVRTSGGLMDELAPRRAGSARLQMPLKYLWLSLSTARLALTFWPSSLSKETSFLFSAITSSSKLKRLEIASVP